MRLLAVLLVSSAAVFGQTRLVNSGFGRTVFPSGVGPGQSSAPTGFGRIVYPGTGAPAVLRPGVSPGPVFPVLTGPVLPHQAHSARSIVPVPVFYGGYNGFYDYEPPAAPTVAVPIAVQQPYYGQQPYYPGQSDQQQPPVVIINQYFRSDGSAPETQTSTTAPAQQPAPATVATAPQQDDMRNVFLIAMKDHTIYAANSYWVEDDTLNFITIQGDQNSASMELVDRELSQRLNRDRKVAFGLPTN
jgi:hypothetical protein